MISKLKVFEKYLNLLLVFLIPTQFALHFWPEFSLVFGIRVDYLSPTIYLTDVLFAFLFIPWLSKNYKLVFRNISKNKFLISFLTTVIILDLFFTSSFYVSLTKWIKIVELVFFGMYIKERGDVFNTKVVAKTLFFSLVFFSLIGLSQFIRGRTFGGIFYLLGERSFSMFTPGIALVNLLGANYLRIYSTFPHPNSLAGFIGVSAIFLFSNDFRNNVLTKRFGMLIICLAFVLTFSLSAYVGLVVVLFVYFVFGKAHIFSKKLCFVLVALSFILSFNFALFSKPVLMNKIKLSQSFKERVELAHVSGQIFSRKFLTGAGLNTFIPISANFTATGNNIWLLQPVHNVYLLIFSETGILGILLLYFFLATLFSKLSKTKNKWGILLTVFVLTTSLFDHYWFTIQQNLLLLSLFWGISFREIK